MPISLVSNFYALSLKRQALPRSYFQRLMGSELLTDGKFQPITAEETTPSTNFCETLFKTDPCRFHKQATQLELYFTPTPFPFVLTLQSNRQMPSFHQTLAPSQNIHWAHGSHAPVNLTP
jgi:hypothetical protein